MLNKQLSHFDDGWYPSSLSMVVEPRAPLFYADELEDDERKHGSFMLYPEDLLENEIYRHYQQQRKAEQLRRQQYQRQPIFRPNHIMMQLRQEEEERKHREQERMAAERKRKEKLAHMFAQEQQRKRNELAAAILAQQEYLRREEEHRQQVEYARQQRLEVQRRKLRQRQLEEQRRKKRQAALMEHMKRQQDLQMASYDNPSPLTPPSFILDGGDDMLQLLLHPRGRSDRYNMEDRKKHMTVAPTTTNLPFVKQPYNMEDQKKHMTVAPTTTNLPFVKQPHVPKRGKRKPIVQGSNEEQQIDCNDLMTQQKMMEVPNVTFHNCFNLHNQPIHANGSGKKDNNKLHSSPPSTHDQSSKPSTKKSSVLIGDVEDASDDEYEEESVWVNRRPSEGQWIEPVMYNMPK